VVVFTSVDSVEYGCPKLVQVGVDRTPEVGIPEPVPEELGDRYRHGANQDDPPCLWEQPFNWNPNGWLLLDQELGGYPKHRNGGSG
jgi:hypothetical protein